MIENFVGVSFTPFKILYSHHCINLPSTNSTPQLLGRLDNGTCWDDQNNFNPIYCSGDWCLDDNSKKCT
jgi:hypothetical protein